MYKRLLSITISVFLICGGALEAQTFTIPFSINQSSPPVTFSLDGNGVLMSTGTDQGFGGPNVLTSGEQGTGTRFLWYPSRGAIRAGYVDSTQWNDSNIGPDSVAFGWDAQATAPGAIAIGRSVAATSYQAVALNENTTASGIDSTAIGASATATGNYGATAIGNHATAIGQASLATNNYTNASGQGSVAMGNFTYAPANFGMAVGNVTAASSYSSFVIGQYNLGHTESGGSPNLTTWVSSDPVFEIGNGTGSGSAPYSDALVVYKDGSAKFSGPVTVPPSGDIPMYTGN